MPLRTMFLRHVLSSLLFVAGCSPTTQAPLATVDRAVPPPDAEGDPPDSEEPARRQSPLGPALDWPQLSYRFPADVAYIGERCIVTIEGDAFCQEAGVAGYARTETPNVALMHAAASSPGCKSAPDRGAACAAGYRAAKRRGGEQLDGARVVDGLGAVQWTEKHVFGTRSHEPYALEHGGRRPKRAAGVVEIDCSGEPGLIWLRNGKVDGRCGYDTSDWKDIVQISGRIGMLCGVSRRGELRCTSKGYAKPPPPLQGVAEVSVGADVCVRMRDGSGSCFGQGLQSIPSSVEGAVLADSRTPLRIEGLTAIGVANDGMCVATGKRLFCTRRRARRSGVIGVRGLPAMVAATRVEDGGAGIDALGETVVWGAATDFQPRRSDVRLTAVGGGVAVDEHGHLLEYRASSGHWVLLLPDFWPTPPTDLRFVSSYPDGCAESHGEIRCWTKPFDGGPAEFEIRERLIARTTRALEWRSPAFDELKNITFQDADVVVTEDGRVWFDGSDGVWSGRGRWIPQLVPDGPEEPTPRLEPRPLPQASPGLKVPPSTSSIQFDRASGYCASSGGAAYCFGRGSDPRGHELRRTRIYDGFSDISLDGRCALMKHEVRCRGKGGPLSTSAVALVDSYYVEADGTVHELVTGKVYHHAKLPSGIAAVSLTERHWVVLESNGVVTLVSDRSLGIFGGDPEFPSLTPLNGSDAIASAPRRICGLQDGTVTCADGARVNTRTAGSVWTAEGIEDATKLVMGGDKGVGRACALTKKGRVVCFGQVFLEGDSRHPIASGLVPTIAHGDEPPTDLGIDGVTDIWLGPRGGLLMVRDGTVLGHEMNWASVTAPSCLPKVTSVGDSFLEGCAVDEGGDLWCWSLGNRISRVDLEGQTPQVVSSDGQHVLTKDGAVLEISGHSVWSTTPGVWPGSTEGVRVDGGCAWKAGLAPRCFAGPRLTDVVVEMGGTLALTEQGTLMCRGENKWSACSWDHEWLGLVAQPPGRISKLRDVGGTPTVHIGTTRFVCSAEKCVSDAKMPDRALFDELSNVVARVDSDGQTYLPMPTTCYGQGQTALLVAED